MRTVLVSTNYYYYYLSGQRGQYTLCKNVNNSIRIINTRVETNIVPTNFVEIFVFNKQTFRSN